MSEWNRSRIYQGTGWGLSGHNVIFKGAVCHSMAPHTMPPVKFIYTPLPKTEVKLWILKKQTLGKQQER